METLNRFTAKEWELTFNAVPDLMMILDTQCKVRKMNAAMAKKLQIAPAEAGGLSCGEAVHGKECASKNHSYCRLPQDHPEHTAEVHSERLGGDYLVTCTPLRNKGGRVIGRVLVARDITAHKQAEEHLRQLAQVSAASSDYIVLIGADYRYRFANEIYLQARRLRPEEILGHHMIDIVGREMFEELGRPQVDAAIRGETVESFEWTDFGRNEPHYLHVRVTPFREPDGTISSVVMTGRDITDIKRAEEEKEKLREQLNQAQKMESVGRLAGGVAHDFNNMLGVILGHTELALLKIEPGKPLHAELNEISKAAQRSADLTRQLLAFARKQTVSPKLIDLNETVEGALKMLRRLIGEEIDLAWLPGGNLGPVFIDPSQVDQILANLCVNARDAIAGMGKVTITTGNVSLDEAYCAEHTGLVAGEFILLAVSDDGCGMDSETLLHLFEPFFTTKQVGKGTGLGLATVYGVIKQNNGFIHVDSEPGHGTTFKIYLPRHSPKAARRPEKQSTPAPTPGGGTILLVEDEPSILEMTTLMLKGMGYTVIAARTPGEAIRLAREHPGWIDLLMTDVVMPEMNGRDLARNIMSIHPDIKRLYMSGYTANVIAHHGVLDKGVHFIQKPFSMKELATKTMDALKG
jgi:PAS domain S-box-containing protein